MDSTEKTPVAGTNRLREAGLRATAPRLAILEILEGDRRHPTAEMLRESLRERYPAISLSTVYATLEVFLKRGLVRRVSPQSGRLRVDGTVPDHDHATCRLCGEVFDIGRDQIDRPAVPAELPAGLRVTNLFIEYEVVCPACESQR